MTKKKKEKLIASSDFELDTIIHDHSLFFDKLIELIPARFYLPTDDKEKPWFQGLSKVAKASAKKESRENIKKARRARLDPDKSTSTLDLLKQSLESEKSIDGNSIEEAKPQNRSVTHEELVQRLHRRLQELRSKRNTATSDKSKKEKKDEVQNGKRKRKRNNESAEDKPKVASDSEVKNDKDAAEASEGLTFGHVKIGNEEDRHKKKRKLSKLQMLEKARRLEEAKKDPEKGEVISKKHSWKAATNRAAGIMVHDNPKLLKQSLKKEKKRHQKSVEKWNERIESVEKVKAEKQQTRSKNIYEKIHQKKMRRIAKREKKLMRPGFEGRKEGFINES